MNRAIAGTSFSTTNRSQSLEEYAAIDTQKRRVECFRRGDGDRWILESYSPEKGDRFELASLEFVGSLTQLYQNVPPPNAGTET